MKYELNWDNCYTRYNPSIWNAILSLILHSAKTYDQTLMFRTTIRYPERPYPNCNDYIVNFLDSIKKSFKRDGYKPLCLWVKEFGKESIVGNHHFHIWWALNIEAPLNPFILKPIAEHFWGLAIGDNASGLVNIDRLDIPGTHSPYGIMLSKDTYNPAWIISQIGYKAMYLAKTYSKEFYAQDDRSWSVSQVPRMAMDETNKALLSLC